MPQQSDALKNSMAQSQPATTRQTLFASMGEPAASATPAVSKAWRTKPCRFWAESQCKKGDRCAFAHVDDQGRNWHAPKENRCAQPAAQELPKRSAENVAVEAASGSSATASVKRLKLPVPEKQHEDDKQFVRVAELINPEDAQQFVFFELYNEIFAERT